MAIKRHRPSRQEAELRRNLGIHCPWQELDAWPRERLHNSYRDIIDKAIKKISDYDADLTDIREAFTQITRIDPFPLDHEGAEIKKGALNEVAACLRRHGLPYPLPMTGVNYQRLKVAWKSINVSRRRLIRVEKCREYGLPQNSSWARVEDHESRLAFENVIAMSFKNKVAPPPFSMVDLKFALSRKVSLKTAIGELRELRNELSRMLSKSIVNYDSIQKLGDAKCGSVVISRSQSERLQLKLKLCEQYIAELDKQVIDEEDKTSFLQQHIKHSEADRPEPSLLSSLVTAIESTTKDLVYYIYLRRWQMPDGTKWYKLGITNNPQRREAEQNILPVPAQTLECVEVESMARARSIEAALLRTLADHRIRNSGNRELFHLTPSQFSALRIALKRLSGPRT